MEAHAEPATIDAAVIHALRDHGYSDTQILDVVGLVSLNVLTGTFNLVAGLKPAETASTTPTTTSTIRRAS